MCLLSVCLHTISLIVVVFCFWFDFNLFCFVLQAPCFPQSFQQQQLCSAASAAPFCLPIHGRMLLEMCGRRCDITDKSHNSKAMSVLKSKQHTHRFRPLKMCQSCVTNNSTQAPNQNIVSPINPSVKQEIHPQPSEQLSVHQMVIPQYQQANVTLPVGIPFTLTPAHQLESLMVENRQLKEKVAFLEGTQLSLQMTLMMKDQIIAELQAENVELRARIVALELKVTQLETRVTQLDAKQYFRLLRTAVQDLSSVEQLETKLPHDLADEIADLRGCGMAVCYFVLTNDPPEVKQYKYTLLKDKLSQLSPTEKEKFGSVELVDAIIQHINGIPTTNTQIAIKKMDKADRWWEN